MCVIITESQELNYDKQMGVDTRALFDKSSGFEENEAPGRTHPGGPKQVFRDKEVPMFFIPTPKGIITPKLLDYMLKIFDDLEILPRKQICK